MAIEQQMEMFALGGLDDDGMSRDPVSGNEIPPGSMANEVRDDVDAKLSDGEYVVPANVVRFFGVKFFEDLRNQAMQGLSAMEANGRIGGEPVPEAMPMQDQMAGAANELTEQDMAMLQSMMNEGGYVQGYNHGGLHDPITEKPIAQTFSPGTYPINQFLTPGASTISSALNPYVAPSTPPSKITGPGIEADSIIRYVTYEKPGSGEIRVIAFRGDTPVNPDEVTSALQAGYFPQGSSELAQIKADMNRDPEQDQSVQDGTKPANRQTVGELLWSAQTGIYNEVFPDSLSAKVSTMGSFGALGQLGKMLPDGPSKLEQSIREAERRLASGKDYQGVAINAAEKAALELLVSFKGEKDMTKVYDAIYNKHGIHTGGKSDKYKRDIRVPDLRGTGSKRRAERDLEATEKKFESTYDKDSKTYKYGSDKEDDGFVVTDPTTGKKKDYRFGVVKDPTDLSAFGGSDSIAETQAKNKAAAEAKAKKEKNDRDGDRDSENNRGGGSSNFGDFTGGQTDRGSNKTAGGFGGTGRGRSDYNKGGLLKKPTKKKKTKK